jgi:dihydrofolate reductase
MGAGDLSDGGRMMSRVVVTEFVSLDGVMEDPGGAEGYRHKGWSFKWDRGPEGGKFKMDELFAADALLLGRVTYQGFAKAWPSMKDDAGFADKMNNMRKYVVSSTLKDSDATWHNTTVLRGDVAKEVASLKAQPGGDLLVEGSATLAHALTEHRLVDEYRLMVFPVLLGSGKRLFSDVSEMAGLELIDVVKEASGVLLLRYAPAKS